MKKKYILILLLFGIFIFFGCSKISDDIIGSWDFQTFSANNEGRVTWTFRQDGRLIRTFINNNNDGELLLVSDTSSYSVSKSMTKKLVIITGSKDIPGSLSPEGTLRISKFKDGILIMTRTQLSGTKREDAYLRCELIRKN